MEIKSGKAKEIWGRKFRIVKNGLDEREVFSFIGSLIDQNREYAKKLEHLDSLVRVAENMIIEADKQAEGIKIEAEEKAGEKAKAIIIQAEEQTKAETERIITEAERSSQERISAAEQLGRDIVKAAEEKAEAEAEDIIAKGEEKAKAEAEKIIAEVEATTQERVSTAEQQTQYILKTAEEKAEEIKAPAETTAKAVPGQPASRREEGDQREKPVPHEGTAELVIGPPVDLGKMQKVLNRLTKFDQIRVLDLEGSKGKGIRVKLFSRNVTRLLDRLVALPEVEKVSDLPRKVGKICPSLWICPGLGRGSEPPARRLLVTMAKRTTCVEI